MSKQSIYNYYNSLDQYKRFGGSRNESSIRRAFANLLEEYCIPKHHILVDELPLKLLGKVSQKRPDGTIKDALQLDWGHWESKDAKDNIDEEIQKKFELGYPTFNIFFENSVQCVLFVEGNELMRGEMKDVDFLDRVLTTFVSYERPEIQQFHKAIEHFKQDIPDIIEALRSMIASETKTNKKFISALKKFTETCRQSINPEISDFDIREMLIQHILTAEIFDVIFGDSHFHRENNIAHELETVVGTFFTGATRRNTLSKIDNYYKAIKAEAARINDHHEKQQFLKVLYENFYKAYNPKGADRLGVVYTPNEIVHFMIESTDYLLDKYFGKNLADKNVEILDPATGTGTFITDIIEHIPPQYLKYKYKNEIHANEMAILPYYIANLNIEFTYQQKMGQFEHFENIVFVDTLDNLGFSYYAKQTSLFALSGENMERIERQNNRKISVIIGNPPYNARQPNYNDFNPNKKYQRIDQRIKDTYAKFGTAQNQNVIYDAYTRFYRWATDRITDNGIICFISNNSFLHKKAFDGFRKSIQDEFDYAYFIDLGGDLRDLSGKDGIFLGEKHTVFGLSAMVGISIAFLIKDSKKVNRQCKLSYIHPCDIRATRKEKLDFLLDNPIGKIQFENIIPDKKNNWINLTDNDFDDFIPLIDKNVKLGKGGNAMFKLFSLGIASHRDEWIYDFSKKELENKIKFFIEVYQNTIKNSKYEFRENIAWDRELKKYLDRKISKNYELGNIIESLYRPFTKKYCYLDKHFIGMPYQVFNIYSNKHTNCTIAVNREGNNKGLHCIASNNILDLHSTGDSQCLPLYRYNSKGEPIENITDWSLNQFVDHYSNKEITKEKIFHYVYGVLHNPAYRRKYEQNLKREFPRIPFYNDFFKWEYWGKTLMDLHINYETVDPYNLKQFDIEKPKETPNPKLKPIPEDRSIILDENTTLTGIPAKAWEYKLGNRSALHWILDQYKEKKPTDKTIAEKFNNYRFADYKEQVIDLIKRVCTVSVKTMEIVDQMEVEETH